MHPQDPYGVLICRPLNTATNEIRLLEILTGTDGIECNLKHISLDDEPDYTALSYTWGNPERNHPIVVNGAIVQVTENVHVALTQLREDGIRTVWIDALCIYQDDMSERNHEVRRMGQIYQRATRVIAWLGEEDDQSGTALQAFDELGQLALAHNIRNLDQPCWRAMTRIEIGQWEFLLKTTIFQSMVEILTEEKSQAMQNLCSRMWWKRVWVIQEIIVARSAVIKCGKDDLPWTTFCAAHSLLDVYFRSGNYTEDYSNGLRFSHIGSCLGACNHLANIFINTKSGILSLGELFYNTCFAADLQATEPRDRIYSLLSLLPESQANDLAVDYSAPCNDIFTEAAALMFKDDTDRGRILEFCDLQYRSSAVNAPTWVPDWTTKHSLILAGRFKRYSANGYWGNSVSEVKTLKSNMITLKGARVDVVDFIVTPTEGLHFPADVWRQFAEIFVNVRKKAALRGGKVDRESLTGSIWRALFRDYNYAKRRRPNTQDTKELQQHLSKDRAARDGIVRQFRTTNENYQRLFVSKNGHVCFASKAVEIGDEIHIVSSCQVPLLLRPVPGSEGQYMLVSVAWVSDVMDGEFVRTDPPLQQIFIV